MQIEILIYLIEMSDHILYLRYEAFGNIFLIVVVYTRETQNLEFYEKKEC